MQTKSFNPIAYSHLSHCAITLKQFLHFRFNKSRKKINVEKFSLPFFWSDVFGGWKNNILYFIPGFLLCVFVERLNESQKRGKMRWKICKVERVEFNVVGEFFFIFRMVVTHSKWEMLVVFKKRKPRKKILKSKLEKNNFLYFWIFLHKKFQTGLF